MISDRQLVVLPDPTDKLMPLVLGLVAIGSGLMASLVPGIHVVGRVAAWIAIIGTVSYLYVTTVRRLAFDDEGVDIQLTKKRVRILYEDLDHVTVRAMPLGATLHVTFVTRRPPATIRSRTGLISGEMNRVVPQILRLLVVHGVPVNVPGRPDLSTR